MLKNVPVTGNFKLPGRKVWADFIIIITDLNIQENKTKHYFYFNVFIRHLTLLDLKLIKYLQISFIL